MIQVTGDNIFNILCRGLYEPDKYWRIISDDGKGFLRYAFCTPDGQVTSERAQTWVASYEQVSLYAYSLLDGTEYVKVSPVIAKIRQMEKKYANRKVV